MNLSSGEKMVWGQAFVSAMGRGLNLIDAGIHATNTVEDMRKLTLSKTWEGFSGHKQLAHQVATCALSMINYD